METPEQEGALKVYNTLTRTKEVFEPAEPGQVRMYNCGPTVYNYFHIGNARNFVAADVIRRYLEYRGYQVTFVQNITDIDDKIIKRAEEEGVTTAQIAETYTQVFFESSDRLGVRRADHHPKATEYVEAMVEMIRDLESKGYAYAADGDVFFRVRNFQGYGKLSGKKIDDLVAGSRVEENPKKEFPLDFVLWKAAKPGEPKWSSPWGEGRPGWHSECVVMSSGLLGAAFDIHMGGLDLIFPHHENEIAQAEAATGKPFVRYWLHNGFLNVNKEKMSKSLGNFFTIDEILEKAEPSAVRYFLMSAHYRAPLDFSDAALDEAAHALERLRTARQTAQRLAGEAVAVEDAPFPECFERITSDFCDAMDDDFNTPRALAALFDAVNQINQIQSRALEAEKSGGELDQADRATAGSLAELLDELAGGVLGLDLEATEAPSVEGLESKLVELLIEVRGMARKSKQFDIADHVRDALGELGFELVDRPSGTEWTRK